MSEVYYLVVFDSINYANYLESELRKYGYEVEIMQTPEQLSDDSYNICLKVYQESLDLVMEKIREDHLKPYKICKYHYHDGKKIYSEVKSKDEEYDEELLNMLFGEDDNLEEDNLGEDNLEEDMVDDIEEEEVEEILEVENGAENEKNNIEKDCNVESGGDKEEAKEKDNRMIFNDFQLEIKNKQSLDPIDFIKKLYKLREKQ